MLINEDSDNRQPTYRNDAQSRHTAICSTCRHLGAHSQHPTTPDGRRNILGSRTDLPYFIAHNRLQLPERLLRCRPSARTGDRKRNTSFRPGATASPQPLQMQQLRSHLRHGYSRRARQISLTWVYNRQCRLILQRLMSRLPKQRTNRLNKYIIKKHQSK